MDPRLPEARLRPQGGADRLSILRGQARDGARTAGNIALVTTKSIAMVALCGAGLFAIGAGSHARSHYDTDRQLENIRRMNESTLRMLNQPKIDFSAYYQRLDALNVDRSYQLYPRDLQLAPLAHEDVGASQPFDTTPPVHAVDKRTTRAPTSSR